MAKQTMKVYTAKTKAKKKAYLQEALENKMYLSYGMFQHWFKELQNKPHIVSVKIARKDKELIGIMIMFLEEYSFGKPGMLAAFVKEEYRRQGVGTMLRKSFKRKNLVAGTGIHESALFWKANNVADVDAIVRGWAPRW